MKILLVYIGNIDVLPPLRSLMDCLLESNHELTLICQKNDTTNSEYRRKGVKIIEYISADNIAKQKVFIHYFARKKMIRESISKEMENKDVLWLINDKALVEVGIETAQKYKYIITLYELTLKAAKYPGQTVLSVDLKQFAEKASAVVVPEFNRAKILETVWELKKTPFVLPNKPYTAISDESFPQDIQDQFSLMQNEKKKIVLYQGIFHPDRNLDIIADAIKDENEYVFYIMGGDNEHRKKFSERHPEVIYLGYIAPPYHVYACKYAHIGTLPYTPQKINKYVSGLNALYCAPNKIFEYAEFNLPMIGPDVPGLVFPFKLYHIGETYSEQSTTSVKKALNEIDRDYESYKSNCKRFFDSVDVKEIVNSILFEIDGKKD